VRKREEREGKKRERRERERDEEGSLIVRTRSGIWNSYGITNFGFSIV
jgi:hypothetical protein